MPARCERLPFFTHGQRQRQVVDGRTFAAMVATCALLKLDSSRFHLFKTASRFIAALATSIQERVRRWQIPCRVCFRPPTITSPAEALSWRVDRSRNLSAHSPGQPFRYAFQCRDRRISPRSFIRASGSGWRFVDHALRQRRDASNHCGSFINTKACKRRVGALAARAYGIANGHIQRHPYRAWWPCVSRTCTGCGDRARHHDPARILFVSLT